MGYDAVQKWVFHGTGTLKHRRSAQECLDTDSPHSSPQDEDVVF